jgi:ABC-type Mn2+/Zn2+ transport system ATPase subunit
MMLSDLLAKLAGEGRLVIASHHDLASVKTLFDEVLVLNTGQVAYGNAAEILTPELISETFAVPA